MSWHLFQAYITGPRFGDTWCKSRMACRASVHPSSNLLSVWTRAQSGRCTHWSSFLQQATCCNSVPVYSSTWFFVVLSLAFYAYRMVLMFDCRSHLFTLLPTCLSTTESHEVLVKTYDFESIRLPLEVAFAATAPFITDPGLPIKDIGVHVLISQFLTYVFDKECTNFHTFLMYLAGFEGLSSQPIYSVGQELISKFNVHWSFFMPSCFVTSESFGPSHVHVLSWTSCLTPRACDFRRVWWPLITWFLGLEYRLTEIEGTDGMMQSKVR